MDKKTYKIGDRVEVLHRGRRIGKFGTIRKIIEKIYLVVDLDGSEPDDFPVYDESDNFKKLESD